MDRNTIIPLKIIDDLYIRFIFAAPTSEKSSLIRMMFRVELAHWFYWDYHCKKDIKLPKVKFRQFLEILINKHCFMPNFKSINDTLSQFREYKNKVPVYGLIMVSTDFEKVVLVQNYETRKWVFPKGKINESESPVDCAIREGIEETGFDVTTYINPKFKLRMLRYTQEIIFYLVAGIPTSATFKTTTNCEISGVRWFDIDELINGTLIASPKLLNVSSDMVVSLLKRAKPLLAKIKTHHAKKYIVKDPISQNISYGQPSNRPTVKVTVLPSSTNKNRHHLNNHEINSLSASKFSQYPSLSLKASTPHQNTYVDLESKHKFDPNIKTSMQSSNISAEIAAFPKEFKNFHEALSSWYYEGPNPFIL